jgi:hypothetical protein
MYIGQEVMIIGDQRCPMGGLDTIADTVVCDMGDKGARTLYGLSNFTHLDGLRIFVQAQHLMPVDDMEVTQPGGLVDLEFPV